MDKVRDARAQSFDGARKEGAVDEPTQARVPRRLCFEQRMALEVKEGLEMRRRLGPAELVARHDMQDLAAEAPIAQQCRHIRMAGRAPIAILLPFEHRYGGAQLAIDGIGIIDEIPIARIETDASACSVDLHMLLIRPSLLPRA